MRRYWREEEDEDEEEEEEKGKREMSGGQIDLP